MLRSKPLSAVKVSRASGAGRLRVERTKRAVSCTHQEILVPPICYQKSQALVNSHITSSLPVSGCLPILRGPGVRTARLEKSRPAENNRSEADVGMVTMGPASRPPHVYRKGVLIRLAMLGRALLSGNGLSAESPQLPAGYGESFLATRTTAISRSQFTAATRGTSVRGTANPQRRSNRHRRLPREFRLIARAPRSDEWGATPASSRKVAARLLTDAPRHGSRRPAQE